MGDLEQKLKETLSEETIVSNGVIDKALQTCVDISKQMSDICIDINMMHDRILALKDKLSPMIEILDRLSDIESEENISMGNIINEYINTLKSKQKAQSIIDKALNIKPIINNFTMDTPVSVFIRTEKEHNNNVEVYTQTLSNIKFNHSLLEIGHVLQFVLDQHGLKPTSNQLTSYFCSLTDETLNDCYKELLDYYEQDKYIIDTNNCGLKIHIEIKRI